MNSLLVMAQIAGRRCAFLAPDVQSVIEIGIDIAIVDRRDTIAALEHLLQRPT